MLAWLNGIPANATVIDVGCSTGYLLDDLRACLPTTNVIGLDLILSGLRKAHANVPEAGLAQADARYLPIGDATADAVVSANLLEHVPDDYKVLAEIRRVLRPGATAVLVVPASPKTFDYYDRFLQHQRRYARGELAEKCRSVGLDVIQDCYLCSMIFPVFWVVKKRNRRRYNHLEGYALTERVARDIAKTHDSTLFTLTCRLERWLHARRILLPFGIRCLTVVKRPEESS